MPRGGNGLTRRERALMPSPLSWLSSDSAPRVAASLVKIAKDNLRITAKPSVAAADSSPPLAAKALDEVRAGESRRMASEGRTPLLKKSRWLLLKREENLKAGQRFRLRDLLRSNLKTVRAYLSRMPSSNSGITTRPPGPASSWTNGVARPCVPASGP